MSHGSSASVCASFPSVPAARLERIAASILRDEHRAADVLQEAWIALHARGEDCAGSDSGRVIGLVRNLARNARRAERRRQQRERSSARAERMESTLDALTRELMLSELERAVRGLPPLLRAPLQMRYLEQQDSRAVAARLGRPTSTVKRQVHRGLRELRRRLQAHAPDGARAPDRT